MLRALLFILSAGVLLSQDLSLGVQGGVPFGDFFLPGGFAGHFGRADYTSKPVPYTIGPTAEVGLPFRLGLETGALYQRFHYSFSGSSVAGGLTNFAANTTGDAWSFPVLIKWRPMRRYGGYFGGGAVIRHLSDVHQVYNSVSYPPTEGFFRRETRDNPQELRKRWYPGVQFAGGWDFQLARVRFSPEIRYTRWTANVADDRRPLQFSANRIELLVGIGYRVFSRE